MAGLVQRGGDGSGDGGEIEFAGVGGEKPAVFGEALHDASGESAFADATETGEDDAGVLTVGIAEGAEGGAEFAAAADEVVDTKLRDGAGDFIDGAALKGLFGKAEIGERAFSTGEEETGGGYSGWVSESGASCWMAVRRCCSRVLRAAARARLGRSNSRSARFS